MPHTSPSIQFFLTKEKLTATEHLAPKTDEGAHVCFRGYVRDNNPYKDTTNIVAIEYHCYTELAQKEGLRILQEASSIYHAYRIFCIHRIGIVSLQEASIHVEVVHSHRLQAFQATQYIMDTIKKTLPIWKQEITVNGEKIWT